MKPLWERYGLFSLSGSAGRLGGGKKDLSMLFVYSCVDHYLQEGGHLGFVITQSVFKTKGAGDGFRRFEFKSKDSKTYIVPKVVDDMSTLPVFEGATNRTAIFVCQKSSEPFSYPVKYNVWRKGSRRQIDQDATLEEVKHLTEHQKLAAIPTNNDSAASPWLTAPPTALSGIQKVTDNSNYQAYAGCCTWLNSAYWIRIIKRLSNGDLLIENLHDEGKIKLDRIEMTIEPDLVYPLLRGRDIHRWFAKPSAYIVLSQDPHKRTGIPEKTMKLQYPKSYSYLKNFEQKLRNRSGFKSYFRSTDPFYSVYNVGPYTLSPWKIVYKDLTEVFQCAVIGSSDDPCLRSKPVLPDVTSRFIGFDKKNEAHFIAALLNSHPSLTTLHASSVGVQTQRYHPSDIQKIKLPKYDSANPLHNQLVGLSKRCHKAAASGDMSSVAQLESEIDEAAAQLWDITEDELKAIKDALKQMKRSTRKGEK